LSVYQFLQSPQSGEDFLRKGISRKGRQALSGQKEIGQKIVCNYWFFKGI
jgi:hypothetical protein